MKVGDVVELVDESETTVAGTVVEIVVRVEDEDGEIWEVPVDEATVSLEVVGEKG